MPSYEVALIIQNALKTPELKGVMKKACQQIFNQGGLIRNMENLGLRELPYPMKGFHKTFFHGHFFAIQFESSAEAMAKIDKSYKEINEIIRFGLVRNEEEPRRPCLDGPCLFGELPNPDHERVPMPSLCPKLHIQAWTAESPPCSQTRCKLELSLDSKDCQHFLNLINHLHSLRMSLSNCPKCDCNTD